MLALVIFAQLYVMPSTGCLYYGANKAWMEGGYQP